MVILLLERKYPKYLHDLGNYINCPHLHEIVRCFLYAQHNPTSRVSEHEVDISCCPIYSNEVQILQSAVACFMLQVISQGWMECIVNAYEQHHHGKVVLLAMIVCLLKRIPNFQAFKDCMLLKWCFSLLLLIELLAILVLLCAGFLL